MVKLNGRVVSLIVTVLLGAALGGCASAMQTESEPRSTNVDLGEFVAQGPPPTDLPTVAAHDLAVANPPADAATPTPPDLAQPVTPQDFAVAHDLSMLPPPDMSMAPPSCSTTVCTSGKTCSMSTGAPVCSYVAYTPCGSVRRSGLCDTNNVVYCDVDGTLRIQVCGFYTCSVSVGSADCN